MTLSLCSGLIHAQTAKVWPKNAKGNGVTYGADVKLTLFKIQDVDQMNGKFEALGMDLVRIPIIAPWGSGDNRYATIKDYADNARGHQLDIFASIANTNGVFKSNGELDDAHNGHKFPNWMKCTDAGGTLSCTNDENGYYGVKLPKYKSYLNIVVHDKLGGADYLGPWNEDAAGLKDYQQLDIGIPMVGAELWSLEKSAAKMLEVKSAISVGGAHNYDDDKADGLLNSYQWWADFYEAGGRWFTESTRFSISTANGIGQILPAIAEGMSKIIVYQTAPRILWYNGGKNTDRYDALKTLIDHSKDLGAACEVETNHGDFPIAAFKEGNDLLLHLCNLSETSQTMFINLKQSMLVDMNGEEVIAFGGGVDNVSYGNNGKQIKVKLAPQTYAMVKTKNLREENLRVLISKEAQRSSYIAPNPVIGKQLCLFDAEDINPNTDLQIISLTGVRQPFNILQGEGNAIKLDISSITPGAYLLILQKEGKTVKQRFLVQ
ncbi:T9SS type A sorting domain-containing protein [Persicobacter diffluens]|uniref:Secretion system C-terminal sorting domain-containing protein n=1 Tax=Persicobacter diffluens TaxID=981 RepID=A0AAN5AMH5_9BACT|nr:hypothetical protein PEDI_24100 [Persicobacter diffluens]